MASINSSRVQKPSDQRSVSCETVCSSNSSCFYKRRKPVNPLANTVRSNINRNTGNIVRQRIFSAKLQKLKSVQSQLNDVNYHLAEVVRENKALKILQKRQDQALSKYEGTHADLPRLLKSHEEDIRVLTEKNKTLKKNVKDLNDQLKVKQDELNNANEQLKHLTKLSKDKHLLEREKLTEELDDLKMKLKKTDDQVNILNRKLTLETKNSSQKLNAELCKNRKSQKELSRALMEVNRLTVLLEETKSKSTLENGMSRIKRFSNLTQKPKSLVSLEENTEKSSLENANKDKAPITEVKLQPISLKKEGIDLKSNKIKGILKAPSENIKARLSSGSSREIEELSCNIDRISINESDDSRGSSSTSLLSRSNSSTKLEKLSLNLDSAIKKSEENCINTLYDRRLGDYCKQVINSAKKCNTVIDQHKEYLYNARSETDQLIESLNEADNLELNLNQNQFSVKSATDSENEDLDMVNQILDGEINFRMTHKMKNDKKNLVDSNDKMKLLATLKAIDNGDNVDSFESSPQNKMKLIKELFGDVND